MAGKQDPTDVVEDEDLQDEEGAPVHEQKVIQKDPNIYSELDPQDRPKDSPISTEFAQFYDTYGVDSYKLYNFRMLDEETIIYSAGISYKIHNIRTGEVKLFFSINGGGIGAVAVHPQQKYFAVAEKGSYPNIYIYEFPSLKLYRIMRYGTERSYSNISFSLNGDKLASVGSQPDYNICIWDWRNEILVLKAKAFSQEVFRVVFSTFSDTILSTSGLAHLRFWKIANTFTGLKLKGQTGKFGSVELSDITGFTIFPDGKVLSGSENGKLLLWEGNLIKAVLSITPEKNCHEGVINTVVRVGDDIVSAGNDGKIKFWEFRPIDEMEPNEQLEGFVAPIKEFQLVTNPQDPPENQRPAQVMEIIVYKDYWLVHDGLGKVFKVRVSESGINQQEILNFNSGKIKGLASSREGNAVVTIGEDGGIRLLDFVNRKEYYSRVFKGKGSCIEWLNVAFNSTDKYVAAGFKNGIVRIAYFSKDKVYLQQAMKVHNNPVTAIKLSPNGELMAVLSQEGELFFLSVESAASKGGLVFKPICIHPMNKKVNYIMWGKHSERLLLAAATGEVIELDVRDVTSFDSSETYLNDSIPSRSYSICMMEFQKPKIDENDIKFLMEDNVEHQEVEWDPASISAVHYINEEEGEFICAAEAEYAGYYYICRFDQRRPIKAIQTTKNTTKFFSIPRDSETLISGTENGEVYIRPLNNMETFSLLRNHDQNSGLIVGALYNPSMTALITAAEDATVLTKAIDLNYLREVGVMRQRQAYEREQKKKKQGKGVEEQVGDDAVAEEGEEEEYWSDEDDEDRKFKPDAYDIAISEMPINTPDLVDGLDEHFFVEDIADRKDAKDIIDDSIYSIQEEKLLAEEDKRKREAEQVKEEMRQNITKLRESFEIIKKSNSELDSFLKLEFKDFNIDDEYYKMLQSRVTDMLDEANKEVSWTIEYHKMKSKKLKDFYLSELDFNRFSVKSFKKPFAVTTMKIKQPNLMTRSQWGEMEPSKLMEEKKEEHNNTTIDEKGREIISTDKNMIELWIQDKTENGINKDINFLKEKKKRLRDNQGESSKEKFTRQKMKADKDVRSKMKQELLATKPSAKTANENEEIKKAEASMGNYVLKSDPNYEVPNTERMSMKKQQRMIYLYEEFIYGSKKDFNTSLQNMREWKERLFAKIISSNERIKQINKEIGEEEVLWNPEYDLYIEFPERILEVSPEEVHDLAKEKEEERLRKKMGRFGGAEVAPEKEIANSDGQGEDQPENKDVWKELEIKDRKNVKTQISKLEAEMNQIKQLKLKTEKKLLIEEMESEVKDFDEKLDELSQKKIRLESEMKFIQMKLLTSYQELIILEAFEAKDMYLLKEYEEQKAKDKENTENINKNTLQITEKKESMKTLELKQKEADDKFYEKLQNTVSKPVANAAYEFFKATDKKSKPTDDGNEDVENQLDDDDEDLINSNVDHEIRDLVKNWRLEYQNNSHAKDKLDAEKALSECKAALDQLEMLRKGYLEEKNKGETQLNEKLEKISTLYVSYFLRLSQLKNLVEHEDENKLPPLLDKSILFTEVGLSDLKESHKKLLLETKTTKDEITEMNKDKKKLEREKQGLNRAHKEALAECEEIYQLKFGHRIPQEILDGFEPTPKLKALEKEFTKEEKLSVKKLEEANHKLKKTKQELLEYKKQNTLIIKHITDEGNKQLRLDKDLDSTNNNITKDEKDTKKTELKNFRKNLKEIIKLLESQIDSVRGEISLYKNKGVQLSGLFNPDGQEAFEENL